MDYKDAVRLIEEYEDGLSASSELASEISALVVKEWKNGMSTPDGVLAMVMVMQWLYTSLYDEDDRRKPPESFTAAMSAISDMAPELIAVSLSNRTLH